MTVAEEPGDIYRPGIGPVPANMRVLPEGAFVLGSVAPWVVPGVEWVTVAIKPKPASEGTPANLLDVVCDALIAEYGEPRPEDLSG